VVTSRGISPDRPKAIQTFHRLLVVFDELANQNKHADTNDLLFDLLFEACVRCRQCLAMSQHSLLTTPQSETFAFIRRYAIEIMLNKKLEAKITNDRNGGQALLDEYRIRVVKHYSVRCPFSNDFFLFLFVFNLLLFG
jgi:hypothetical protein